MVEKIESGNYLTVEADPLELFNVYSDPKYSVEVLTGNDGST